MSLLCTLDKIDNHNINMPWKNLDKLMCTRPCTGGRSSGSSSSDFCCCLALS